MDEAQAEHVLNEGGMILAFKIRAHRDHFHKRIGRKLKNMALTHAAHRASRGWTQREIADELGVSVSTLYRWREELWPYTIKIPGQLGWILVA